MKWPSVMGNTHKIFQFFEWDSYEHSIFLVRCLILIWCLQLASTRGIYGLTNQNMIKETYNSSQWNMARFGDC